MLQRGWIAGALIAAGLGWAVCRADTVGAVEPGGQGVLTKCRGWLIATSCKRYHHISLPSRIAVGETITLSFGSSPKEYAFPVARIAHEHGHCVIFSQAHGNRHQMDKINVARCHPVGEGQ
jgi:hypothetical protein